MSIVNPDPNSYNTKDILTQFIIPALNEIRSKLDTKADATALSHLEKRVDSLERIAVRKDELGELERKSSQLENALLRPDTVRQLIAEALSDAQSRGLTKRDQIIGIIGLCFIFGNLALTLAAFLFR